jgi:hypothetical protein
VHGYFGNGVWNGFEQANATKHLLEARLEVSLSETNYSQFRRYLGAVPGILYLSHVNIRNETTEKHGIYHCILYAAPFSKS